MLSRLLALFALVLTACGGGGGGGSAGGGGGDTPATLRGVVAVGAPLVNASISVVDAKGVAVGSATSHAADGSYSLTLTTSSPSAPLLIQARGMDASGAPQVLHSAVPNLAPAMVAHLTPLTQATLALALGADPASAFAAKDASAFARIAAHTAAAGDFLKTLLKTPLSDLKISDPKALDLLADANFSANKGVHDLLIESLRIDLARNLRNQPVLQLANRLAAGAQAEVVVDLGAAQAELAKTGGTPANAITSTLKFTTSPTTVLTNLGTLDELGAALNQMLARGLDPSTLLTQPLVSGYDKHDGLGRSDLAGRLYDIGRASRQLGRFQVLGCADDAPTAGNCSRVLVAAPVSDASGRVVELFLDAVSYNKAAATANKWNLIGNGRRLAVAVSPLAFRALKGDGTADAALSPNPGVGLAVEIQSQSPGALPSDPPTKLMDTATVQMPGGFSLPFGYCNRPHLCLSPTPGATNLIPTGGIGDIAVQRSAVGWVGGADTVRGARFIVNFTSAGAAETRTVYLRSDVLADPPASRLPTLDGVSATAPLKVGDLQSGSGAIAWGAWAAANPELRLVEIRRVFAPASGAPTVIQTPAPLPPAQSATLTGSFIPAVAVRAELWLGAQDASGRRYYTRYTAQP